MAPLPGGVRVGDTVLACNGQYRTKAEKRLTTAGDVGIVTGDAIGTNIVDKETLVHAAFEGVAEQVDANPAVDKIKYGAKIGKSKFAAGDTGLTCVGFEVKENGRAHAIPAGSKVTIVCLRPGSETAATALWPEQGLCLEVDLNTDLVVPGCKLNAGWRNGDIATACFENRENGISAGDEVVLLSADRLVRANVLIQVGHQMPISVDPTWQLVRVGQRLNGGLVVGQTVVSCVQAGHLVAFEEGVVLGPCRFKKDLIRCGFPRISCVEVDTSWQVSVLGSPVKDGLQVGDHVQSLKNKGDKVKKGDLGRVLGPFPDNAAKIRCIFPGSASMLFLPADLVVTEAMPAAAGTQGAAGNAAQGQPLAAAISTDALVPDTAVAHATNEACTPISETKRQTADTSKPSVEISTAKTASTNSCLPSQSRPPSRPPRPPAAARAAEGAPRCDPGSCVVS